MDRSGFGAGGGRGARLAGRVALLAGLILLVAPPSGASAQEHAFDFGGPGTEGPARLAYPNSVATDTDANVWVADLSNDRIVKYEDDGRFIAEFKAPVGGGPDFTTPWGIGADGEGFLYVAQGSRDPAVVKIDRAGRLVRAFSLAGADGVPIHAYKVAVDEAGRMYVNDGVRRILVYSPDGRLDGQIDLPEGWTPVDVVVYEGEVLVSARTGVDRSAIRRYGADRRLLNTIGPFDDSSFQEIDVDPAGRVLVVDRKRIRVRRFRRTGEAIDSFGEAGPGAGEMQGPEGIAVDCLANIYVGDTVGTKGLKFAAPEALSPPCPSRPARPPRVTSLDVAAPLARRSSAVVIAAAVAGNVTRLEWDLTGNGRFDVVGAADQPAVRFRPPPGRRFTVGVRAVGPGGAGPVVSESSTAPAALAGATARRIAGLLERRRPVYAVGPAEGLAAARSVDLCAVFAPTTVKSGSLEFKGCLDPVASATDIPVAERGIVDRVARELRLRSAGELRTGIALTDSFVARGPVEVNGVTVSPNGSGRIVVFPQAGAIASSNATMSVGGHLLRHTRNFVLRLNPARSRNPLGTFSRPRSIAALGGLNLLGDVGLELVPGGALFKVSVRLPGALRIGGAGAQGRVELRVRDGRLIIDGARIGPLNVDIGALSVRSFQLDYRGGSAREWRGQGRACVIGGVCLDMAPPNGQVRIRNGRFDFAGASLRFPPPGIPLFKGVHLERIGFGTGLNPTRMTGNGRIDVLRVVAIDGPLVMAFPSAAAPFVLDRSEVGGAFPNHFYGRAHTRTTLGMSADALVKLPVLGDMALGGAYLLYEYPGYVALGGGVNRRFLGIVSMTGLVSGELNLDGGLFNLHGNIGSCLHIVRPLCSGAVANISRGRGGTGGAGACLKVGPASVGGGVQWLRVTRPFIWPLDGCKWSRFAADVRSSRAMAAQAGTPHVVRIRTGDRSRAIQLDGDGAAPVVRVRGPGGVSVRTTPGSGLTHTEDGSIRILRFEGAEVQFTVVGLQDPRPGTYTIEPLPASADVNGVSEATDPPAARAIARVRGRGTRRVLEYAVRRRPAQRVTFLEVSRGGEAREIGVVRGGGVGRLRFSPAPGAGARRVVARFELAGVPAERRAVARFRPPSPRLARPLRLRARRTGARLNLSWRRVPGALGYQVALRTSGGVQRLGATRRNRVVLRVPRSSHGRVTVRAVDRLRTGPVRGVGFRRTAHRGTRFSRLPRCSIGRRIRCTVRR